jgi:hypothetical protein
MTVSDLVKVKPLEWQKSVNFDGSLSWRRGEYRIDHFHAPAELRGYSLRIDGQKINTFSSLDAAQAAAQADYTVRILGALDLTGVEALQAEVERLREALKAKLEGEG